MLNSLSLVQKVALLVSLPVAAAIIYYLVQREEEEDDEAVRSRGSLVTSRHTVIEVPVPKDVVGAIIGSRGANIKQIQDVTGARVNFRDEIDPVTGDRIVLIRGTHESAQHAELLVRKAVAEQPVKTTELIYVPANTLGRIIGKGGETIRSMCRSSKARILVDRDDEKRADGRKKVEIIGTTSEIENAKFLIMEKVEEDEAQRNKVALAAANRPVRGKAREQNKLQEQGDAPVSPPPVPSIPENAPKDWPRGPEYMAVYVSAVEHPAHFWVQLINSQSTRLDRLQREMTTYYSQDINRQSCTLEKVSEGDLVVAPYDGDESLYRARVETVLDDGRLLDLYYVDYGDNGEVSSGSCMALRSDYLKLPFQAYECALDKVCPVGGPEAEWSEEAITRFEQLVYMAAWKPIQARTSSYLQHTTTAMPCLALVDTNTPGKDVNIADTLVAEGLAEWRKERAVTSEPAAEEPAEQKTTYSKEDTGEGSNNLVSEETPKSEVYTRARGSPRKCRNVTEQEARWSQTVDIKNKDTSKCTEPIKTVDDVSEQPAVIKLIVEEEDSNDKLPGRRRVIYANLEEVTATQGIRLRERKENGHPAKEVRDSGVDLEADNRLDDTRRLSAEVIPETSLDSGLNEDKDMGELIEAKDNIVIDSSGSLSDDKTSKEAYRDSSNDADTEVGNTKPAPVKGRLQLLRKRKHPIDDKDSSDDDGPHKDENCVRPPVQESPVRDTERDIESISLSDDSAVLDSDDLRDSKDADSLDEDSLDEEIKNVSQLLVTVHGARKAKWNTEPEFRVRDRFKGLSGEVVGVEDEQDSFEVLSGAEGVDGNVEVQTEDTLLAHLFPKLADEGTEIKKRTGGTLSTAKELQETEATESIETSLEAETSQLSVSWSPVIESNPKQGPSLLLQTVPEIISETPVTSTSVAATTDIATTLDPVIAKVTAVLTKHNRSRTDSSTSSVSSCSIRDRESVSSVPSTESSSNVSEVSDPAARIRRLTDRLCEVEEALDGISDNIVDLIDEQESCVSLYSAKLKDREDKLENTETTESELSDPALVLTADVRSKIPVVDPKIEKKSGDASEIPQHKPAIVKPLVPSVRPTQLPITSKQPRTAKSTSSTPSPKSPVNPLLKSPSKIPTPTPTPTPASSPLFAAQKKQAWFPGTNQSASDRVRELRRALMPNEPVNRVILETHKVKETYREYEEIIDVSPSPLSTDVTLEATLEKGRAKTLDKTLDESQNETLDKSLDNAQSKTPDNSVDVTLKPTLEKGIDRTLDKTLDESRNETLDKPLDNGQSKTLDISTSLDSQNSIANQSRDFSKEMSETEVIDSKEQNVTELGRESQKPKISTGHISKDSIDQTENSTPKSGPAASAVKKIELPKSLAEDTEEKSDETLASVEPKVIVMGSLKQEPVAEETTDVVLAFHSVVEDSDHSDEESNERKILTAKAPKSNPHKTLSDEKVRTSDTQSFFSLPSPSSVHSAMTPDDDSAIFSRSSSRFSDYNQSPISESDSGIFGQSRPSADLGTVNESPIEEEEEDDDDDDDDGVSHDSLEVVKEKPMKVENVGSLQSLHSFDEQDMVGDVSEVGKSEKVDSTDEEVRKYMDIKQGGEELLEEDVDEESLCDSLEDVDELDLDNVRNLVDNAFFKPEEGSQAKKSVSMPRETEGFALNRRRNEFLNPIDNLFKLDWEPELPVSPLQQKEDQAVQQIFQASEFQQPVSWPERFGTVELEEDDLAHCELASSCAGDMSAVNGNGKNLPLYDIYFGTADLEIWKEEEIDTDHISREISDFAPKTLKVYTHEDDMIVFDEVVKTQPNVQLKGGGGEHHAGVNEKPTNVTNQINSKENSPEAQTAANSDVPAQDSSDSLETKADIFKQVTSGYKIPGQAMKRRRRLWEDDKTDSKDSITKLKAQKSEEYEDSLDEDDETKPRSESVSEDSLDELLYAQPRGLRYTDLLHSSPNLSQDSLGQSSDSYEQVSGAGYVGKLCGNEAVPIADEEVLSNFTDDSIEGLAERTLDEEEEKDVKEDVVGLKEEQIEGKKAGEETDVKDDIGEVSDTESDAVSKNKDDGMTVIQNEHEADKVTKITKEHPKDQEVSEKECHIKEEEMELSKVNEPVDSTVVDSSEDSGSEAWLEYKCEQMASSESSDLDMDSESNEVKNKEEKNRDGVKILPEGEETEDLKEIIDSKEAFDSVDGQKEDVYNDNHTEDAVEKYHEITEDDKKDTEEVIEVKDTEDQNLAVTPSRFRIDTPPVQNVKLFAVLAEMEDDDLGESSSSSSSEEEEDYICIPEDDIKDINDKEKAKDNELTELITGLESESKWRIDEEHVIKLYLPDLKPSKSSLKSESGKKKMKVRFREGAQVRHIERLKKNSDEDEEDEILGPRFDIAEAQEKFPFIDGGGENDSESSDSDTGEGGDVYELVEPIEPQRMLGERVEMEEEATSL